MFKRKNRLLSGVLAASVLLCSLPMYATATEEPTVKTEYTYSIDGLGNVTSAFAEPLGAAATLYTYQCADSVAQTAYVTVVDPARGGFVRGENLGDSLPARDRVSSAGEDTEKVQRLAAVNADFFSFATGVPMGLLVEEGRYLTASDGREAVFFREDGSAFFGRPNETVTLRFGETELPISYVNKYPSVYGIYLQTRDYGNTAGIPATLAATEVIFALQGDLRLGGETEAAVVEIRNAESGNVGAEIPEGCASLVIPDLYDYAADYRIFAVEDTVTFSIACEEPYTAAVNAIGGGDVILRDGEIVEGAADEEQEKTRQPRTALGITEDGKILLCVIDGRQSGYSLGVKLYDLAKAMQSLGCTDAINFDGGGSSVMVRFDGETPAVVNRPSDKTERLVTNAAVAYANREAVAALPVLDGEEPSDILLAGVTAQIPLRLIGQDDFAFTEDNTTVSFDEELGSIRFADGKLYFTAGNINGLGAVHIAVETENGRAETVVFLRVTTDFDPLRLETDLLLMGKNQPLTLTLRAKKNGQTVNCGDNLSVALTNPSFMAAVYGDKVTVAGDGAGEITFSLGGKTLTLPIVAAEEISLGSYLQNLKIQATGSHLNYAVLPAQNGGVIPGDAFTVTPTFDPEDIPEDGLSTSYSSPLQMKLSANLRVTGLVGRKLWMWADGLEADSAPYAVFTADGKTYTLPYTVEYDSRDFNGRALLSLTVDIPTDSAVTLQDLLCYRAGADGILTVGPIFLADAYDANPFADLNAHWSKPYVTALSYMDILSGSEDLTGKLVFRPDDGLTREQFAKILIAYLQLDVNDYTDVELAFDDFADIASWAMPYVRAAVGAGLMRGRLTPQDTLEFAPQSGITRQEAIYVLGNLLPEDSETALSEDSMTASPEDNVIPSPEESNTTAPEDSNTALSEDSTTASLERFTDYDDIAPWAVENLARALAAGLITGYADGSLQPGGGITRAEAAALLLRLWNNR